jgi:hypothetical protein
MVAGISLKKRTRKEDLTAENAESAEKKRREKEKEAGIWGLGDFRFWILD